MVPGMNSVDGTLLSLLLMGATVTIRNRYKCFLLEGTGRVARWLRRYSRGSADGCRPYGYHNAMRRISDSRAIYKDGCLTTEVLTWPVDDPRWPEECEHCGYIFRYDDHKQLFYREIHRTNVGSEVVFQNPLYPYSGIPCAPPGAMLYEDWRHQHGPDGRCLTVMTPAGEWVIDGESSHGGGWRRTGIPPEITVSPSIRFLEPLEYHAILSDGYLEDC